MPSLVSNSGTFPRLLVTMWRDLNMARHASTDCKMYPYKPEIGGAQNLWRDKVVHQAVRERSLQDQEDYKTDCGLHDNLGRFYYPLLLSTLTNYSRTVTLRGGLSISVVPGGWSLRLQDIFRRYHAFSRRSVCGPL